MMGMSRAGLAERWPLFAGAFVSVTLGVALVQSSLLLLISAAVADPPASMSAADKMAFSDNLEAVVAMLGIVLGIATFLAVFVISSTFAFTVDQRRLNHADLVVETTGPVGARIAAVPGVASASTETSLPASVTTGHGEDADTDTTTALVIEPTAYAKAHGAGSALAALSGRTAAAGPTGDLPAHGTIQLKLPDFDLGPVPLVAGVPARMNGDASLLLPSGLVPARVLASAPTRSFVTLAKGADPASVRASLAPIGKVSDVDSWLRADADTRTSTSNKIMLVIMGLGGLYALIGVINSIVIGAAARRREFAEARVTGLTRSQVIRSALAESSAVTVAGLLLGALAGAGALIAAASSTRAVTGFTSVSVPWSLLGAVCVVALAVTAATSLITSWSATRRAPVTLLGARE
jgi:putative ABC transport system permease protein